MKLDIWLERSANRYTDKEAVFHGTICIGTYMDLWRVACSLRRQLEKVGVKFTINPNSSVLKYHEISI